MPRHHWAVLWINATPAHAALSTALLQELSPQWDLLVTRGISIDVMYGSPDYAQAAQEAERRYASPTATDLEQELGDWQLALAEPFDAEEQRLFDKLTGVDKPELPPVEMPQDLDAFYSWQAERASARAQSIRLSGQYVFDELTEGRICDLILRNENLATLGPLLRSEWQASAYGTTASQLMAPAVGAGGRAFSDWYQSIPANQHPVQDYLQRASAFDLPILCADGFPDGDCPMGTLMLFANPADALNAIDKWRSDPRVQWWDCLSEADGAWRQEDWPLSDRVPMCAFDLREELVCLGGMHTSIL